MAIRAKVKNSGSTVPTVSLLPGNEVPQRTLANKMRTTSRSRAFTARGRTIPALSLSPPRFLRKKRKKFKGFSRSPEWRVGSHVTASGTGDRNSVGAEDGPRKTDRNRGRGARPGGGWCGRRLLPDPATRSDRYDQGRVHDLPDRSLQRRGDEFAEWDRHRRELDQQPRRNHGPGQSVQHQPRLLRRPEPPGERQLALPADHRARQSPVSSRTVQHPPYGHRRANRGSV